MNSSVFRILTLAKRNFKSILRDKVSVSFLLILPLGMEILFYYIFHELTPQFEMKYFAPGIVVFSQAFLTLFIGLLIAVDRNTEFLTRLFVSKAKPYEFILGYMLAVFPIILLQSVLFFVVGGLFDMSLFSINLLVSIVLSLFTSMLFINLGILFGSLCNEKSIGGVASIVVMGQSILSGMWFPIDALSKNVMYLFKILPFKNATDLIRNSLNNSYTFNEFGLPCLIVLGYIIITFFISILSFKRNMKTK